MSAKERMTFAEALSMYTMEAAYAAWAEDPCMCPQVVTNNTDVNDASAHHQPISQSMILVSNLQTFLVMGRTDLAAWTQAQQEQPENV